MSEGFNVDAFMNTTVDGPMATNVKPVPEGEYMARIGSEENDVAVESIQGVKDPTKTYVRLTLWWDIIDEALKTSLGRDKIRVRDQFLLDTENGQLKTGPEDNVSLGQRRAGVGLNSGSFNMSMFRGAGPAMIRVGHRADPNDAERKFSQVTRVAPIK